MTNLNDAMIGIARLDAAGRPESDARFQVRQVSYDGDVELFPGRHGIRWRL